MDMKKYKVYYNNGNDPLTLYAKSVVYYDGKYYVECLYHYTIKDTFIKEVKEIESYGNY